MNAASILAESTRTFFGRSGRLVLLAAVVFVPLDVAVRAIDDDGLAMTLSFVTVFGHALVQAAVADTVLRVRPGESSVSLASYRRVAWRAPLFVLARLATDIGIVLGLLLFVIPGLVLVARWSVVIPVLVNERKVGLGLSRSWSLVLGRSWTAFWAMILPLLWLPMGALIVLSVSRAAVSTALIVVGDVLFVGFGAVVSAVLYARLVEAGSPPLVSAGWDPRSAALDSPGGRLRPPVLP